MTSDLSKEAADLVNQGRAALRPNAADKARVLSALKAQLPPAGLAPAPTGGGIGGMSTAGKTLLVATGAVAVVAAVVFAWQGSTESLKVQEASGVTSAELSDVAMPIEGTLPSTPDVGPAAFAGASVTAEPTAASAATSTLAPAVAVTRGSGGDRLGEEVALLTRAQREFHAGNFAAALGSVDEHRRKFARGTLVQERVKLRVKILCGLGRTSEANTEQHKLERASSGRVESPDVCSRK
jgi:hypothetical protein